MHRLWHVDEEVLEEDIRSSRVVGGSHQSDITTRERAIRRCSHLGPVGIQRQGVTNAVNPDMVGRCTLVDALDWRHFTVCGRDDRGISIFLFDDAGVAIACEVELVKIVRVLVAAYDAEGIVIRTAQLGGVHFDADVVLEPLGGVGPLEQIGRSDMDFIAAIGIVGGPVLGRTVVPTTVDIGEIILEQDLLVVTASACGKLNGGGIDCRRWRDGGIDSGRLSGRGRDRRNRGEGAGQGRYNQKCHCKKHFFIHRSSLRI